MKRAFNGKTVNKIIDLLPPKLGLSRMSYPSRIFLIISVTLSNCRVVDGFHSNKSQQVLQKSKFKLIYQN